MENDRKGVRLDYSRERIYLLIESLRDPSCNKVTSKKRIENKKLEVTPKGYVWISNCIINIKKTATLESKSLVNCAHGQLEIPNGYCLSFSCR